VTVPARNLVARGDAHPVAAARWPTPAHAIESSLPHLPGRGRLALVIGLGGLGQIAAQTLRVLTGATVIAAGTKAGAVAQAQGSGAVT